MLDSPTEMKEHEPAAPAAQFNMSFEQTPPAPNLVIPPAMRLQTLVVNRGQARYHCSVAGALAGKRAAIAAVQFGAAQLLRYVP